MKKIFISTTSFAQFSNEPIELLKSNNFDITINELERKLNRSDCLELYGEFDGIIAGTEGFDQLVLDKSNRLKVISRVGVGIDNIDINYAKKKGIKVLRTKTSPSLAVAELVVGLIINLNRKISLHHSDMKKNIWNKRMGSLLTGKTLGIIGLGNIGKTLVKITKGFSLKYLAYDKVIDSEFAKRNNVDYSSLNYLLAKSDIISVHLNLTNETKNLISDKELNQLKSNAILINTSRSEILDETYLLNKLSNSNIAVGLDVFSTEPYNGPLINYDNVITTPHIASYAQEIRIKMEIEAAQNLIKEL